MLVPCQFRGDHKVRKGFPHGPSQCPPPPGKHGDHWRNKRLLARRRAAEKGETDSRGTAVSGVGGSKAKSHRLKKKAVAINKA